VSSEVKIPSPEPQAPSSSSKHIKRLKIIGVLFTILGVGLFSYFIYTVGLDDVFAGIGRIGFGGFALIVFIYFLRILTRAASWKLSVYEPYQLDLRDTVPAVMIGEAMSSMIPLGILISGTTKAVAVRDRVPLVVGLSSVATENLFYSLVTGLYIVFGAFAFLKSFDLAEGWVWSIDIFIAVVITLIFLGILMVIRQWHFASAICERLYDKGVGRKLLENGRMHVRLFENLIYGYYRRYPRRFLPIILLQITFHTLGIIEIWFILNRLSASFQSFYTAFLLESMSRTILIVFKLIPFVVGIDEAGAQFVTETLALGAGLGIMVAVIRKGRALFWTTIGVILIIKRGLSVKEIKNIKREDYQDEVLIP
jgi:hypothetical protein